jgi:hypothetical protein
LGLPVASGDDGIALFEQIRYASRWQHVFLIEVNGDDMPRVMQATEATLTLSCQGTITVR